MKVSVVIPARRGSERLPGKITKDIGGKPMLWHVWNRASQLECASEVVVAVDHEETKKLVESWGGKAYLTPPECTCGTHRIAYILDKLRGDFILNIQADECFIRLELLNELVECYKECGSDMVTPVYRIKNLEDLENPNVVKAVLNNQGKALYFSRSAVPFMRGVDKEEWLSKNAYWWHVGVYGYARNVLERYSCLPESALEGVERLEQLRFLEAGYDIQTIETDYHSVSVDTDEDLKKANELIASGLC